MKKPDKNEKNKNKTEKNMEKHILVP